RGHSGLLQEGHPAPDAARGARRAQPAAFGRHGDRQRQPYLFRDARRQCHHHSRSLQPHLPEARREVADRRPATLLHAALTMLELPERLRAIVAQEYPRFSDAEYARRHRALAAVMEAAGVDHLLIITDHRVGNAPQWVTGWPGTVEAYVVFRADETITMHVEWFNHFPL